MPQEIADAFEEFSGLAVTSLNAGTTGARLLADRVALSNSGRAKLEVVAATLTTEET